MKTHTHTTGQLWRHGVAALGLSTLLATIAVSPMSASAQSSQRPSEPVVSAVAAAQPAPAAPQIDQTLLRFQSASFFLAETRAAALQQKLEDLASPAAETHILVQLDGPVTSSDKRRFADSGLELQTYVSNHAWFAKLNETGRLQADQVADLGKIRAASAIAPIWKLNDWLAEDKVPTWTIANEEFVEAQLIYEDEIAAGRDALPPAVPNNPKVGLYVMFHPDVALMPAAALTIAMNGGRVRSQLPSINSMVVEMPFSEIRALAADDSILYIEPALPRMSELNDSNRARVQADELQAAPYGLDGTGVNVLIYDGGRALATHGDFGGRLTVGASDTAPLSDHSTHVSGTVGGSGLGSAGTFRGMAPGVTLISYGFEQAGGLQQGFLYTDPGDFVADYTEAMLTYGAVLANNSIGTNTAPNGYPCDWEGNYGLMSNLIDDAVRGGLGGSIRIVWANGNERQSTRCLGIEGYPSPYHSTAPPACAKNHITVGALNSNDDSMTTFSSWGPTDDGRIKPDISAPGCQSGGDNGVTSTNQSGGYNVKCGTSMASPTVCGISALIVQAHRQATGGGPDITSSALKAVLANTAVDLGPVGADYQFGHGSIRAKEAVDLIVAGNYRDDSLSQNEVYTAIVLVSPGDTELRVTLTWDDYPAAPNPLGSLVNDLDLHVYDSSNTRYFPYTLQPFNPTAAALTTLENHVDNIEQVVIPNAAPGAYLIEVHGFNVPQGPQTFSLAGSPSLVTCAEAGIVSLGRSKFACSDSATLQVVDCGLNTNSGAVETVDVTISSDTEPGGEIVTLTEISAEVPLLRGTISMSQTDAPGVLHISPGDTITMTYIDADDGGGGINIVVQTTADVDCTGPSLVSTQATQINPRDATINVEIDELSLLTLNYGTNCGSLTNSVNGAGYKTSHNVLLSSLTDNTTYYYTIEMTDQAGNSSIADNGGLCYSFTTPEVPDFFTEQFSAGEFDLDGTSILFVPDSNVDEYIACSTPIATLPIDPAGGTVLSMTTSSSINVPIGGGDQVQIYGTSFSSIFISSNGYITFSTSDTDTSETLADHFDTRRVSLLFDDLDPSDNGGQGQISWKKLSDRFVVTWLNVPQNATVDSNTFQCQLYYDGRIEMSWLGINPNIDCIVGLSEGVGVNIDFLESLLDTFPDCGPRPPSAANRTIEVPTDLAVLITLQATDDGTPLPPSLDYIIQSLPTFSLRDAGNNALITPGMLPYTLLSGGNQVTYQSSGGFTGNDGFSFVVDDGGTPPTGGPSNLATVGIIVLPVLTLPFADTFASTEFSTSRWYTVSNATIDDVGIAEPSPTLSARFNGLPSGGDSIVSHLINTSTEDNVRVSYYYQVRGGGESPDANDDLFVEYLNNSGSWVLINQHLGSLPDMTTYAFVEVALASDAIHTGFRLRIRNTATSGAFDDWFVDDILIGSADAPQAVDLNIATPANVTTPIALNATDPNGDPLVYFIQSLPTNGTLRDPFNNQLINSAPYMLLSSGSVVAYKPNNGYNGFDSFTYRADDGVHTSNIANVIIDVGGPLPIYTFNLDTNPGWTTQGDWAFGQPTGGGTHNFDPNSGFTGANVLGYNLAGDYPNNMAATLYLTTTALDLTDATDVSLQFRRWLGVESASFDHANIQVSNNGSTWTTVYEHIGVAVSENTWSLQSYDISAVADNQATVFIRWGMGPTDGSVTYPGWNIDDIVISGRVPLASIPGDINNDGTVDVFDLFLLLGAWGVCPGCPEDLNNDGVVDVFDLFTLLSNWTTGIAPRAEQILADINGVEPGNPNMELLNEKFYVNNDVLAPAEQGGFFEVEQSYRQTPQGELGIEIAGRLPIDEADILVIPGRALLDGKLTVWFANDFVPQAGDTFIVLVAGKVEGQFADVLLPALSELEGFGPDARFELTYDEFAVSLRIPGGKAIDTNRPVMKGAANQYDINRDGLVNVDDVLKLIDSWGEARRSRADLNRDGTVDSQDLQILLSAPLKPRASATKEQAAK